MYFTIYVYSVQSQGEKEQMDTLDEINVILLRNMLPKHVADYYTCRMHKGLIGDSVSLLSVCFVCLSVCPSTHY